MSELSPEGRALLAAARDAHQPTAADMARVQSKLTAALAAGPGGGPTTGGATGLPAAKSLGLAGAKLTLIAGTVVLAAAGALWLATAGQRTAPVAQPNAAAALPAEPAPGPPPQERAELPAPSTVAAADPPLTPAAAGAPPEHRRAAPRPARVAPLPEPIHAPATEQRAADPAEVSSLQAELALLGAAQAALRSGEAQRALSLAADHAQRFPDGLLSEERLATQAMALCSLGREGEAASARAELAARAPGSHHLGRVDRACGREHR